MQDAGEQPQFISIIALQEAEEAALHLFIEGTMHLKEFFAEGRKTEEDLFFIVWQRFLGDEIFGDQPPSNFRDSAFGNVKLLGNGNTVRRFQSSYGIKHTQRRGGRFTHQIDNTLITTVLSKPLPGRLIFI